MPLPKLIHKKTDLGESIHRWVLSHHPAFDTEIDKHLKWIPFSIPFALHLGGVKTRSNWTRQILIAAATEGIRYLIADNLKKLVHERRPAPYTGNHSFPSGHASSSFAGAEFMHNELKNSIPVLSCVGYLGATAASAIRVMKSRHWIKDVVAGAAVGIISAKLAYLIVSRLTRKRKQKGEMKYFEPSTVEENVEMQLAEK